MQDAFLVAAGAGGMIIALVHGYLGEQRLLRPATGLPGRASRVLRGVFHLSTLYWFAGGAVLAALPWLAGPALRGPAALAVAAMYTAGAIANVWAFRGRHFGAPLLGTAALLAALGA